MWKTRLYWATVLLLLVATVVVSVAVSDGAERGGGRSGDGARTTPATPARPASPGQPAAQAEPARRLVVVRRRGGLPAAWAARLRRSDAVDAVAEVARTQLLLTDGAPAGHAYPLDTLVVDPRAYARVTGDDAVGALRAGRVLLSASAAAVRAAGSGDRLRLSSGRTVTIAGIVPDGLARDAEVVAAAADVPRSARRQAQLVVATSDPQAVADAVPDDRATRVATLDLDATATGGAIIRAVTLKRRFGEFAVRLPYGEDWIAIDPAWRARNITTASVPILGPVTCNRELMRPLRRALRTIQRQGLAGLVDPGDFAGCHAPRRIPGSGSLSLHAWGLAVDINASENPQGAEPRQDPRVVRAFERAGFTWGGRWPTAPDGMHFELHEPAS